MAPGRNFVINLLANPSPATRAFSQVGRAAGRLPGPIGIATAAIAASFAAVVAAAGKVVKELVELGEEFNDAYRTIQVGTGAIGDDLEDLRQSFRDVVVGIPSSFDDVAAAMAEVNTRTGLTGDDLEELTTKFLNLSRLTGGEVVGDIRSVTRMFNRFGIESEDMGEMLEYVFAASQATGIGVAQLGDQTVEYGHRINQLGMSLEEGIALFGLIERQGVAVGRVFPSIGVAVTNLREEGFDNVTEGLAVFIDELRTLDSTAAESRAMEVLGSEYRVFLDLVRDNNIDYGALVEQLRDSQGTINETAQETDGVKEAWQGFLNFLKVEFEAPATAVFDALKGTIEGLIPAAENVKKAYEDEGLVGALAALAEEWQKIYEDNLEPIWEGFTYWLENTVKPEVIRLGKEIGAALADQVKQQFLDGMKNLFLSTEPIEVSEEEFRERAFGITPVPEDQLPVPRPGGGGGPGGEPRPAPRPAPPRLIPDIPPGLPMLIPGLAAGGVVSSPTLAVVGEAGPEVVIPLDEMDRYGGSTVNVYVTSADPQAVVDAIRRYTRTNGPLGQVVSV